MGLVSRRELPTFLQIGRAETLTLPISGDAAERVDCTSATFTLLSGETEIVTGAATITNGTASYALASTFSDGYTAPQEPWRERWEVAGLPSPYPATTTFEHEAFLCRVAPAQHVDLESLYKMHPQWRDQIRRSRRAGASSEPIQLAWSELIQRLLGDGHVPHRILNWWSLSIVHRYLAAHIVCLDFATDSPDASRWERRAEDYLKRAWDEYDLRVKVRLDQNEDGVADVAGALTPINDGPSEFDWRWD